MEQQRLGKKAMSEGVAYTSAVDVWAVGIIAYQLLCGRLPFGIGEDPSEDDEDTMDRIIFEPLAFPDELAISDEARLFCSTLLERDPIDRPNAERAMRLPWIEAHSALRTGGGEGGVADAAAIARHASIVDSLLAFADEGLLKRQAYHAAAFSAPSAAPLVREVRKAFLEADVNNSVMHPTPPPPSHTSAHPRGMIRRQVGAAGRSGGR